METDREALTRQVTDKFWSLNDEHTARLDVDSENREVLRTQIPSIRETIQRILNEEATQEFGPSSENRAL